MPASGQTLHRVLARSRWITTFLRRIAAIGLLACAALATPTLLALDVTFNTATEVPVTAAGYTASGEVSFTLGFAPLPGTNLTVIKNTGLPFITGQFSNLGNGATVNLTHNGTTYPFVAWYYGGEGNNDLVLLWPHTGLAAWGANYLGDGGQTQRNAPVGVIQSGILLGKTIVQVARGGSHNLALCSDGTLVAWGWNNVGQLGDNSTTSSLVPVLVSMAAGTSALAGKSVVAVAAGDYHSLALCSDGTLAAWGWSTHGQLGDNSTTIRLVPVAVNVTAGASALAGKTVVTIAAGKDHSLALCSDGMLATWGRNTEGQLGDNTTTQRAVPVAVNVVPGVSALAGKTVVALAAGLFHSVALCSDGVVTAWGGNANGQLGDNSVTPRLVPVAVNVEAGTSALAGKTVVAVAAGGEHSLAVSSDGRVEAWGDNFYSQLGDNSVADRLVPVAVNVTAGTSALAGKTVVALAAGGFHSLALCIDGTVAAWGDNDYGQLGDNSATDRRVPVAVNVAAGTSVLSGRQVSGLSMSSEGVRSIAMYGTTLPEIEVEVLEPDITVLTDQVSTVDFGSALAVGRTFRVRNTGGLPLANLSAQLSGANAASFTLVSLPSSAIVGGGTGTFLVALIDASPGAKSATLEITSNDSDESPFRIALVATKTATLTASFATANDIPLSAPAINVTGAEVNLSLNFAPTPGTSLTVIKNTGPAFISGQFSNLANGTTVNLNHDSTIYPFVVWYYGGEGNNDLVLLWPKTQMAAWGANGNGQLGDNSTTSRLAPVNVDQSGVLLGKTIVQVARGASHSLALCSDGTLAAWGANSNGQLGDNTTTSRQVPVVVTVTAGTSALAGKSVVAVAAGGSHSLALCSDGTLAAWGANSNGQLGDNSTTQRQVPVVVNVAAGMSALAGKTVVALSAGASYSMALCSDGMVVAWGANSNGQLGDNSTTGRLVPVAVNVENVTSVLAGKTVIAITAADYHSLALCSDGSLAAWGNNFYGALGDDTNTNRQVPVKVEARIGALLGKSVIAIASRSYHSLALCSDGSVAAWGDWRNGFGYDVPMEVTVTPGQNASAGKSVIAIAAGYSRSLALCSDGTVVTWDRPTSPAQVNTTAGISALAGLQVSQLSVSSQGAHSIVIYAPIEPEIEVEVLEPSVTVLTDHVGTVDFGSAVAAGRTFRVRNTTGGALTNLSASLTGADAASFTLLNQPTSAITGGDTTSFLVAFTDVSPGTKSATLEITSNDSDETPFRIALVGSRTAILTANFAAATDTPLTAPSINLTGAVVDVTLNFVPTPGTNLTIIKNTGPAFITGQFSNLRNGTTVSLSYAGATYSFVVWYYGGEGNNDLVLLWPYTGLAAWGYNNYGQLGDNSTTNRQVPVGVEQSGVLLRKTIVQVVRGESHSLALCSDGTVAAWGWNSGGQLGDNSTTDRLVPVAVNVTAGTSALAGKTVVALSAGDYHSLALCSDGTLVAWGYNYYGQLGDNSTTNRFLPVAVNVAAGTSALAGKTVVALAAGESHSLALCSDGTVVAWGYNSDGQLGDNSTTQRQVPVAVNAAVGTSALAGKTVVALAAGDAHSLTVCSDGTVVAWGSNSSGELGNNSTTDRLVPVAVNVAVGASVLSGKTVVAVAAGSYHSLALCSDGTTAAWGNNSSGQLGDNSNTQRLVPVAVNVAAGTSALADKTVVTLAAGWHSLALCSDGTVVAWGYNNIGQLGDNSLTGRFVPVAVNVAAGTSVLSGRRVSGLAVSSQGSHSMAIYGTTPPEIEVEVLEPSVTALTDQVSTVDFSSELAAWRTFRVRNMGGVALENLSASLTGADAASFTVVSQPMSLIAGDGTTTFQVAFAGVSPGAKSATLEITSNDGDEALFRITLVGTRTATLTANFAAATDTPLSAPAINLTGAEVNLMLNFAPTPGTNLTVIKNTGPAFISGQFSNLANGATVNLAYDGTTYPFVAWYYGGEGNNDLVLLWPYTGLAAWGYNNEGQLGNNSLSNRLVPVDVIQTGALLGKTIVQVAQGEFHSLALCSDGTLAAWGDNAYGQLGDISKTDRTVPVAVAGMSALAGKTVVAVAAGAFHSLALCSDGTVAAWGRNGEGELGDNSTTDRVGPVAVSVAAGTSALTGKTVVAIEAGGYYNLALCSDGTVAAWGHNAYGQLGDNSTTSRLVPVAVNMVAGTSVLSGKAVVALTAGGAHSLALCSDGTLAAWGYNSNGQLGDSSLTNHLVPVAVNVASELSGKSVIAVAAGVLHSLALCSDGMVAAWGKNDYGQLGDNSTTDRFGPVGVNVAAGTSALAGKAVVALAAGREYSLALCSDGTVAAWGANFQGQLGDNSTTQRRMPVAVNVAAGTSVLSGRQVRGLAVSSQGSHSIAIYGTTPPEIEVEVLEPSVTTLTDQVSTVDFGSAMAAGRTFRVRNTEGVALANLAANLTGADAANFTVVSQPASAIAAGDTTTFQVALTGVSPGAKSATLEITSNDGDETHFRITLVGTRTATLTASFAAATDTPLTAPAINLTVAEVNVMLNFAPTPGTNLTVIKNTGPAFISGQFSNLANGTTVSLSYAGTTYAFVVWYYGGKGNNDLVLLWPYTGLAAWGNNGNGQLGDNSTTNRQAPVDVEQSGVLLRKTIVQVAHGAAHSLALCSDGTVAAWGSNSNGQLGDNSMTQRLVPVAVNVAAGTSVLAGKTVVAVAAGPFHSLALCSDGTVAAWGNNSNGQLGDNSMTQRLVPVAVNAAAGTSALAGKTVVALATGDEHSLALCSDGTVAAWGYNNYGQLGNNSTTQRRVPVAVNVESGTSALAGKSVVALVAGYAHSLALCNDGTVAAWGNNAYGQLGDNSTTYRLVPVAVAGTSALFGKTVVALAAGNSHSLALCSDGTVAAWGSNSSGQLGNNSTTTRQVPVAVNVASGTSALFGKTVVAFAAGNSHSLAFCNDGTVAAWGYNFYGRLGDNSTTTRLVPTAVNVAAGTSALAGRPVNGLSISGHATHSIAIYGQEAMSQITVAGNGVDISQGETTPIAMDFTDFGNVELLNARVSHTFTIAHQGNVPLKLTGTPQVTLSGSGADAFTVTREPAKAVAAGGNTDFVITFDPRLLGSHTAMVTIQSDALNHPSFTFAISGFGALSTARTQTISFAPPTLVFIGQGPLSLSAHASSGLPVTLSLVPIGTTAAGASIVGNALSFTGAGTVKVQAVQAGGGFYAAAVTVVKTITVKANPATLTLLNLAQTYTGTPREISTVGGMGTMTIDYKIGAVFGSVAPTNAGSYPVRATDSLGTKTGTLIIAKAPLYITPDNQRKFVGQDNPPLTLKYSGWVNGESASLVTTAPILKTTAMKTSVGGVYPITASGGALLANYVFIYQQGALVVDSFAASYEALLTGAGDELVGKLAITVTAANTSFTGKLYCIDEKAALSLNGPLLSNPATESATGSSTVTSSGITYVVGITAGIEGSITASVTRAGSAYTSFSSGRRLLTLAAGKTITYSGAHTAVIEPATPASTNTPKGAGWATATISTTGVMTFAGRLGDGTSFTTSLPPDNDGDPTYRLFLQPYKTGSITRLQSHFGGAFTLLPHSLASPTLAGRRYVEAAAMTWVKTTLATDATYPAGFGPVSTVLMLDPWLPPAAAKGSIPASTLATRLGLTNSSFQVLHSDTGSTLNGNLPTRVSLGTTNLVSVATPSANTTKWKTTLVPTTGLFSGSFELADTLPKPRAVTFSGVLRQPATAPDTLIGDGHYLLPPLAGTEKTTGEIMFLRP